jgi:hypothetical protein
LQAGVSINSQNVPSSTRVAAGAFGFWVFSQVFDGPDQFEPFTDDPFEAELADGIEHFLSVVISSLDVLDALARFAQHPP